MWEKISDYCLDISKYCFTAVFVASLMTDFGDVRWVLYSLSMLFVVIFGAIGIYCHEKNKKEKAQRRNKYRKLNAKNRRT